MRARSLARILVVLLLAGCVVRGTPPQPETLRVAMYPFVPRGPELFATLRKAFEADRPGVTLELVDSRPGPPGGKSIPLLNDYYKGGLLAIDADIYEIDAVLLPDMVRGRKIAPLTLPNADFGPEAP